MLRTGCTSPICRAEHRSFCRDKSAGCRFACAATTGRGTRNVPSEQPVRGAAKARSAGRKRQPGRLSLGYFSFDCMLRNYNHSLASDAAKAGFYGLDLYSLHSSIESVQAYLDKIDPEAANRARYRYSCFDHFGEDPQAYGYAASFGLSKSCENEVVSQLLECSVAPLTFCDVTDAWLRISTSLPSRMPGS
jgi:hypothetical protein